MENTNLVATDEQGFLMDLTSATVSYSSFLPQTQEEKISFYNAINNPQKRLKDCVNMEISIQHIYCERCTFVSEDGEITEGVRTVLIDKDGNGYQAASRGIFNCIRKLFAIMGEPKNWTEPVTIIPRLVNKAKDRSVLVFDLGVTKKKA